MKEVIKNPPPLYRALTSILHGGHRQHLISRKGILHKEINREQGAGSINDLLQLIFIMAKPTRIRMCCSDLLAAPLAGCPATSCVWGWRHKL